MLFTKYTWVFLGILLLSFISVKAQIEPADLAKLQDHERTLQKLSEQMVNDSLQKDRTDAVFKFIPKLVDALKVKNSFHYPFDSLQTVSIIAPPDNSFRIFTWQLWLDNGLFRYFGAVQINSAELKLHPLFDDSDSLYNPLHQQLSPENWFGALYYKLQPFNVKKEKYYLLFGYDGNDAWSNRKLVDVLHFKNGEPVFGAPVFQFEDSTGNKVLLHRFMIEYRANAVASLNYSEDEEMIIFDHLVAPEERMQDLKFTQLPDGTYEGFKLKKGTWVHVPKIQTIDIDEFDNPPVPMPVLGERKE